MCVYITHYSLAEEGSSASEEVQIYLPQPPLTPLSAQASMGRPAGKGESDMKGINGKKRRCKSYTIADQKVMTFAVSTKETLLLVFDMKGGWKEIYPDMFQLVAA